MADQSYLDKKYFIDGKVYNCPFCNRNNVAYNFDAIHSFDWTPEKECFAIFVVCSSCQKTSMHLSYKEIYKWQSHPTRGGGGHVLQSSDLDADIFYSVPTSFFVIDDRIKSVIRELITEAESCLKMNFLTGASACMRKAIYELLILEGVEGDHYEEKIKALKDKYPNSDPELFDILSHIQEMTSDKVHEQSWDKWDAANLRLIIETLRTVLYDIYVLPKIKEERAKSIKQLREIVTKKK